MWLDLRGEIQDQFERLSSVPVTQDMSVWRGWLYDEAAVALPSMQKLEERARAAWNRTRFTGHVLSRAKVDNDLAKRRTATRARLAARPTTPCIVCAVVIQLTPGNVGRRKFCGNRCNSQYKRWRACGKV